MEPTSGQPLIEFIDSAPAETGGATPPAPDRPRRMTTFVAILAVAAALLLISSAMTGRDNDDPAQADVRRAEPSTSTVVPAPSTSAPASSIGGILEPELVEFIPWPSPPEDRNPTVIIHPGSDRPMFDDVADTTLVYVNSIGRPTVIALDAGKIEEVEIGPARSYDFFGVEFGAVVSFDGTSRSIGQATDRAVLFHAHRAGSRTESSDYRLTSNPTPHLCLTIEPCATPEWTFDQITNGHDTIRRANATDDPEVMEMLFGDSWTTERTNRISPDRPDGAFRVPAPLGAEVWIVHQPVAG